MRKLISAGIAMALAVTAPAFGQNLGNVGDGEVFLKALEDGDNAKALPLIDQAGSRVATYRGYRGDTGLHIATRKRDFEWVGYLLRKGADPNVGDAHGDTPLVIASRIGFEEAATWLLKLGARVDAPNKRGETALIIAVQQRQARIVEMLLKSGANPDKADFGAGYTARDYAKRDSRNPQLLKLIETVKSTKKQVSGPTLN
jgi:ankyrin repeat protein